MDYGKPGDYVGVKALKPFIHADKVAGENLVFFIPGNPTPGLGISAETFLDICRAYVAALFAGTCRIGPPKGTPPCRPKPRI